MGVAERLEVEEALGENCGACAARAGVLADHAEGMDARRGAVC